MTRSIPMEKAFDDALIAYGQNGEALRPEQGYPARLFLPGFEGSSNVKWIRPDRAGRSSVHDARGNVEVHRSAARRHGPDVQLRRWTPSRSSPSRRWPDQADRSRLVGDSRHRVERTRHASRALTSAPTAARRGSAATLDDPVLPKCHTRFRLPWKWNGRRSDAHEPRHRRDGLRAADHGGAPRRARTVHRRITSTTFDHGKCRPTAPCDWRAVRYEIRLPRCSCAGSP